MNTDVLIVGKGIAALVLSYLLTKKGIDHVLLEREASVKHFALAETLPPSALPLLHSLGLLSLFEANSIRKTYGYHSCWGNDKLIDNNFYFQQPYKYGLKIDKKRILSKLEKISSAPVLHYAHQLDVQSLVNGISVSLQEKEVVKKINARYIVDATGRNRAVLKLLNIKSVNYDHSLSFSCHLPRKKHPKIKHDVFVESFADGWGLVSGLNAEQNVLSLFTQRDSPIHAQLTNYKNWAGLLQETNYLKYSLANEGDFKVRGGISNSSKPEQLAGSNWLAIGDAAMAFDPLSSHGITNALYTAREAVGVVEPAGALRLKGMSSVERAGALRLNKSMSSDSVEPAGALRLKGSLEYERGLNAIFQAYLVEKDRLYSQIQVSKKVAI